MFNSKKSVYKKTADSIEGNLVYYDDDKRFKVEKKYKDYIISMEEEIEIEVGKEVIPNKKTETVFRVAFINTAGLYFRITRHKKNKLLDKFAYILANIKPIELGIPEIDDNFLIEGNDPQTIRFIFTHPNIIRGIQVLINDNKSLVIEAPRGIQNKNVEPGTRCTLEYRRKGIIKKKEIIHNIFNLYMDIIDELEAYISWDYQS